MYIYIYIYIYIYMYICICIYIIICKINVKSALDKTTTNLQLKVSRFCDHQLN